MQFELTKDFLETLNLAVEVNNEAKVLELIDGLQSADIAEIIDEQTLEEAIAFYQFFSQEQAADILIELDEGARERILNSLSSEEIAKQFIDNMDSDDAADVLAEMSDEKKNEVISHLEDFEQASDIVDLLSYEEDTAGLFVWAKAPDYIADVPNWIDEILQKAKVFITPGFIFGTNGERYLRIALCSPVEMYKEALSRIENTIVKSIATV